MPGYVVEFKQGNELSGFYMVEGFNEGIAEAMGARGLREEYEDKGTFLVNRFEDYEGMSKRRREIRDEWGLEPARYFVE